jgi:hypothetical protein
LSTRFHIIFLICLCTVIKSRAQTITALWQTEADTLLVGKQQTIKLILRGSTAQLEKIEWPAISKDSLGSFDIVESGIVNWNNVQRTEREQSFRITAYDSGWNNLPLIRFSDKIKTPARRIYIQTIAGTELDDYRDIKEILPVKEPFNYRKWLIIGGSVLGGLLLLLVLYLWLKKKPVATIKKGVGLPGPNALKALQELEAKRWPEQQQYLSFFTRLDEILKLYLQQKKSGTYLPKTNEEVLLQTGSLPIDRELRLQLAQALRLSDVVKFARYEPAVTDCYESLRCVRQVVNSIEQNNTNHDL